MNAGELLNIVGSIAITRGLSLLLRSARLITIISKTRIINTSVIRSMKGKSGNQPFDHIGRNFKKVESGMVRMADVSAAADVVRFHRNPNRKIESTPGEIKPTYS